MRPGGHALAHRDNQVRTQRARLGSPGAGPAQPAPTAAAATCVPVRCGQQPAAAQPATAFAGRHTSADTPATMSSRPPERMPRTAALGRHRETFPKLGIRSRGELSTALGDEPPGTSWSVYRAADLDTQMPPGATSVDSAWHKTVVVSSDPHVHACRQHARRQLSGL